MTHSPNATPFNREQPPGKKAKPRRYEWHTAKTKYGMGDNYGTGIKQKLGRIRDGYSGNTNPTTPAKLKKPPRSLA